MPPRKASPLRVVAKDDPAPTHKAAAPTTVKAAADSGGRRALLVALRARIATDIDNPNTPPRDLAALSRRLLEIAKEIEALDADARGDDVGRAADTPDEAWTAV